ncbi:uncharacterized protein EI97DRAFT_430142 [Westerdykella ornata]|uniref:Prokaryotic-type class I peptide chain release factors domain-containing protein n=1 Tax=Westerdykella ornata TaxID=318751 RepID=A0A6A6JW27_WESOR|nr:uncharacterized protein EI97DRAFT_430142 [Westerdykella ornata]KAF2280414.1 hypothetical protein EI97DRAFT_430142 [Westerdykella ornata]
MLPPSLLRLPLRLPSSPSSLSHLRSPIRAFTTTSLNLQKHFPPRLVIPDSDIEENFLKGSGPGGQKINKTSSAVQLKHLPTGIVVKCQETRSRSQNRKLARKTLAERVEELMLGDEARTRVKARERSRKKASAEKKKRRKYRALEEAKAAEGTEGGGEGDGDAAVEMEKDTIEPGKGG